MRVFVVALFVPVLALLASPSALALDPSRAITQYVHAVWQTEQGLPQNTVQALAQTTDGYLWVGTQEGLGRFDGVRFTVFDRGRTPGLRHNWVSALFADREGGLWIGFRGGGLARLHEGRVTRYTTEQGLSSDRVRTIAGDRSGNVWIGTSGGGLNRFRGGRFTAFTTRDGLADDQVVAIHEDREGTLWIGTFGGGLSRLKDGRFTTIGKKDGLADDHVSTILEDRQGTLWIGTFFGGLARRTSDGFVTYRAASGLGSDAVWALAEDRDGSLWIGTDGGGLVRYREGRFARFIARDGLSSDVVMALHEDREGTLWAGTAGGGLNMLRDGAFATFGVREGLTAESVLSVYEDRSGTLWLGTDGGGLNALRDGRVTALTTKDGLSNDHVVSIWEDRHGDLWAGTYGGGLNRVRDGRVTGVFTTKQGLPHDVVTALLEDRGGVLWIGTAGGGLASRHRDGFQTFTTRDGLSNDQILAMLEDRTGALWVGTSGGGLNRLQGATVTTFTTRSGLSDDRVSALHEDAEGTLWIGTSGGGLVRHAKGRFASITTAAGLHDDRLFRILEDADGGLWMSSNRGVFRARKADLAAVAAGTLSRVPVVTYGVADGMRSAECNGENQPAGWRTRDGRLWFPTIKGVVVVDPARLRVNTVPPPVVVEEVTIDGAPSDLRSGAAIDAPPGRRKLDVRYTALTFPAPERVRFRYKLEGFDPDWVDAGQERVARYTSLPPGNYTFRVKARNADGIWNEAGAAVALRLQPFFYETRAFRVAAGVALVLFGIGIQRLRTRRLQARARELERIVAEQTRDLRDANDALRRAQEQLARLSEATPEKVENVSSWGTAMAREVGQAIRARCVHLYRVDGAELQPITENALRPPTLDALQAARAKGVAPANGTTIVPVTGLTDELRGAIVVEGALNWGDTERRLVTALAQHLGSTLDLQTIREQLTNTEVRQAQVRRQMLERGVHMLKVCPRCGRCYDDTPERCAADDIRLDATRLLPYRVLDRYRLAFLLGEGGNGVVFEAHDEKLDRDVALKVIRAEILSDPGARFRLEREARALARIKHPSVIALFDSGELADGSAFLVMELLRGRDLAELIRHSPGTPAQVATVLRQVSRALKAAHDVGVVHRDVKPGNIFLVRDGDDFRCKVVDFGLAKWAGGEARLTQSGMLVGTPAYMSPEQVEGHDVDHRTDIYSLATVGYEALTGRPVVPGREVARMLVDVLYGAPARVVSLIPGIPSTVDDAFAAALAKKPEDRPSDIEAWADGLAALLEGARGDLDSGWPLRLLDKRRPGQESAGPRRSEPTL